MAHVVLQYVFPRLVASVAGFVVGLAVYVPTHTQLWGLVYESLIIAPDQRSGAWHAHAFDYGRNLTTDSIIYMLPWSDRYRFQGLTIAPGCTYQQVVLGLWPLFVTRWRPWPVVRGAFLAALVGFGLNFWRLYVTHQLVFWWDAPWSVAHSMPSWVAGVTAFAIGLWYMWRNAPRRDKPPAGAGTDTRTDAAPASADGG